MTAQTFTTASAPTAGFGIFKDMPVGSVLFLVLLAALSFTAGVMFPEVTTGLGLLF